MLKAAYIKGWVSQVKHRRKIIPIICLMRITGYLGARDRKRGPGHYPNGRPRHASRPLNHEERPVSKVTSLKPARPAPISTRRPDLDDKAVTDISRR